MEFRYSEQLLTPEELSDFEKKYQLNLPQSYKDLMLKNNGGLPERPYHQGKRISFLPINHGEDTVNWSLENLKSFLPPEFYPMCDVHGQLLCLSLEDENYGKIYFIDETGEYELVCNSFEDFMAELSDDPDY